LIKSQIDMELLRQAAVKDKLDTDEMLHARLAESNRFILLPHIWISRWQP